MIKFYSVQEHYPTADIDKKVHTHKVNIFLKETIKRAYCRMWVAWGEFKEVVLFSRLDAVEEQWLENLIISSRRKVEPTTMMEEKQ